jgi:hypothetical protein
MLYEATGAFRSGATGRSTRKLARVDSRKRSRMENEYGPQEHDLSLV